MEQLATSSLFNMSDKVCLVTGGSRGIGLMIASAYVANGAKVYISSRKKKVCDQVANELTAKGPGSCISLPADLTNDAACKALAGQLSKLETKLDVLVNNAGLAWGAPIDDFPESAWEKTMNLNVYSIFHLTRACAQLLAAASKGNTDPSHVINIGSVGGELVFQHDQNPSYLASKAAVPQLSRYLAQQLLDKHINVNCIAPAVFPSNMTKGGSLHPAMAEYTNKMHPVGRVGNETDMAGLAIFLGTKASAFVNGSIINLDGGIVALRSSMPPPSKL